MHIKRVLDMGLVCQRMTLIFDFQHESDLKYIPKQTSVTTRGRLWIRAKRRQAIEMLHDLFKLS